MNSNICHRCRIKESIFICSQCKSALCTQCDSFVHSALKRFHKREKITFPKKLNCFCKSNNNANNTKNLKFHQNPLIKQKNMNEINGSINESIMKNFDTKSERNERNMKNNISNICQNRLYQSCNSFYNDNLIPNTMSNQNDLIMNQIPNMSSRYIKKIEEIYEQERKGLISKINQLTQELEDSEKNLSERIDYLHNHLYELENRHKREMNGIKIKNDLEIKKLEEEKNIKINVLQNTINNQNNKINELKEKIKNLKNSMNAKESTYLKKDRDANNIMNEKENLEKYYKNGRSSSPIFLLFFL